VRRWLFAAGFVILVIGPIVKIWFDAIGNGILALGLLIIAGGVVWWLVDRIKSKK
jgi:hypothetical protein